jgi:hypothetical protein
LNDIASKTFSLLVVSSLLASAPAVADPLEGDHDGQGQEVLSRYLSATREPHATGVQMEAQVEAVLPKLHKRGTMFGLRKISQLGKITWDAMRFQGDSTIKKDVIARYIQAETEGQGDLQKMAISPFNYKFKYKGLERKGDVSVHVFQLTPRKKEVGLFKGELWLDRESCLPVREAGQFVKSPSVFLKRVDFVREYELVEGRAVPKHVESHIQTRFWGPADIAIHFANYAPLNDTTVSLQPVSLSRP